MKFDTPATTNPIDQLKVIGKPIDRIDGPLKTTRHRALRLRTARRRHRIQPMAMWSARQSPRAASARLISTAAKAAPGVLAIVTAENAGKLEQGQPQHRHAARRPRHPALPPGDRRRGRGDVRTGACRRAVAPRRLCARRRCLRSAPQLRHRQTAENLSAGRPTARSGDFEAAFSSAPVSSTRHTPRPTRRMR